MKKILGNRKAVSPVLAVLLLIAIAVGAAVVTYAWVMGFVGTQTQQAGGVLVVDRASAYANNSKTSPNATVILTIRNTGTGRATIEKIYWSIIPGSYANVSSPFYSRTPGGTTWESKTSLDIDPGDVYDIAFILGQYNSTDVPGKTFYIRVVTTAGSRVDVTVTTPTTTWPIVSIT